MAEKRIREYIIDRLIGRGGMGSVYLATHVHLETRAALKVLHEQYSDDPQFRTRFINEAKMLHKLHHSNIVEQKEFFEENGKLVLVMEFIAGRGLDKVIGQEVGPIPYEKALPLFKQILEGIGYAHSMGIIHRDIKPANIIISSKGTVKISDLGIAKLTGSGSNTRTGAKLGTLYYMSPEQVKCSKTIDKRTDIYSLGMTLYEMLAGKLPFNEEQDTSEFEIMNSIVYKELPDPRDFYPNIPKWLVKIVRKATSKDPSNRFQSCEEFIKAIDAGEEKTTTKKPHPKPEIKEKKTAPVVDEKSIQSILDSSSSIQERSDVLSKLTPFSNSKQRTEKKSEAVIPPLPLKIRKKRNRIRFWIIPLIAVISVIIILITTGNENPSPSPLPVPSRPPSPPPPSRASLVLPEGMEFVTIPSGSFMMGSSTSEAGRCNAEGPRHSVSISSFELMTTEVTQGMWEAVMGTDLRYYRDLANPDWPLRGEGSNYPMYYVSWNDCHEFIDKLNDLDPDHVYRLASESEWEYACRAETRTRYYWGDSDSESVVGSYCWYTSNSNSSAHPVGIKQPNAWGLYDMSGNVWEWCEDTWHSDYNGAPVDGSAWVSSGASSRVERGGSWVSCARSCRSADRHNVGAGFRYSYLGFRLARSVR